jgi:CHAT domain-containing protein
MCRTGVVLSNAKTELLSGENVTNQNDGILTAKDISYMNLSGLSLAVLSACQTAQGDIGDDGVFGLQRGFKKAGADALLLSLWNVSDEATFFLMETFYKYVLKGMSYHDSLSLAQTDLRNFKNGRFDYPKYWAAFILLDSL